MKAMIEIEDAKHLVSQVEELGYSVAVIKRLVKHDPESVDALLSLVESSLHGLAMDVDDLVQKAKPVTSSSTVKLEYAPPKGKGGLNVTRT